MDSSIGIFPFVCPRCKSFLGAFELTAHIMERAEYVEGCYVCYQCLTDSEKVKFLEEYIAFKENLKI